MFKTNKNKIKQGLDKNKILNRISISDFLLSNFLMGLLVLFFYLILFLVFKNNFNALKIFIVLVCMLKIYIFFDNRATYDPSLLFEKTIRSKLTKIFNPTKIKKSEIVLEHFSDIGYYFNEDISFLNNLLLDNFLAFDNNRSLKRYISLFNSDDLLAKEFAKIITISYDDDFKEMNDKYKAQIVSDLFLNLIKLSLPKVIEYNRTNDKKIKFQIDKIFFRGETLDLKYIRIINKKLFKLMSDGSYSYSFQSPDILNIFMKDSFLNKCSSVVTIESYVDLFREFNTLLELKYIETKKEYNNNEEFNVVKEKLFKKYDDIIEY